MNESYPTLPPMPEDAHRPIVDAAEGHPQRIGRYWVERVLGQGGFGIVYLAFDEELERLVAVKVAHARLMTRPEDADAYKIEARTVANLDHPHIVPVHDVGSTPEYPCFIVSKYIEGSTLAQRFRQQRPSVSEAVEMVATVAETLHYAHRKGLVHRDVKPGNILLDSAGKPWVADFGLALKEENVGRGPRYAGTPAYMSPEQALGEGHRVDGRSDVFSLGVVFYELLTGRRPFHAEETAELLEQIATFEPRPPRQWDDAIPRELERICLKALAKRASDRYTTASDLAADLRHFFEQSTDVVKRSLRVSSPPASPETPTAVPSPPVTPLSDQQAIRIVPKGLRSFDAHDADFFLELLPGPRDRAGLPDSIRLWKTRIEETDADNTFNVGLIYGPSGCGKSSLVKAGLLPRLSALVTAVYVEATPDDTETRLLNALRKRCPTLPANLGLKETLAAVRRGQAVPAGQKVLLVLDQFEQWLHAHKEAPNNELVQALRQCDGARLQCIVLVRDDFWLAVSRFLRDLEVDLVPSRNSALVDLFDLDHGRKVLAAFGRAFGKLPEDVRETSKDQKEFLSQAIAGLAEEGRIISVRLALFAEMMKSRAWLPTTLKAVGGATGVGVAFLEETFAVSTANPAHRLHQKAARAVLQALLPERGTDIKGHMRAQNDLLAASGYGGRPRDFAELMRILDGEIRLITPTDPEGAEDTPARRVSEGDDEPSLTRRAQKGTRYYQLTHDYLVPSLRDWLTRKQKETRRGRAELLLADRATVWNTRPETRQLPSLPQWLSIRLLTRKHQWTPPQRKMMRKAAGYHVLRGLIVAAFLSAVGWFGYQAHGTLKAQGLRNSLLNASTVDVPRIVDEMGPYRAWLDPMLSEAYRDAEAGQDPRKQLHASLALLPVDPGQRTYLYRRLLEAAPQEVPVIREFLAPYKDDLLDLFWAAVEQPIRGQERQRLRAASALALYDPQSPRWAAIRGPVANDLVGVPAVYLAPWLESLRPVSAQLLSPLAEIYRDSKRRETERSLATDILADYAAGDAPFLVDLLLDADAPQFAVLFPKVKGHGDTGVALLQAEVGKKPAADTGNDDKEKLAKRQANAAVALVRLDLPRSVWPLLEQSPDPRGRSYLVHRFGPFGADAGLLIEQLARERDVTIRRALILALGEYGPDALPAALREPVTALLLRWYRDDPDAGIHGAVDWLLRHGKDGPAARPLDWGQAEELARIDAELALRRRRTQLGALLSAGPLGAHHVLPGLFLPPAEAPDRHWYVNGQGQTMVVIRDPEKFQMGSPRGEAGREDDETQHWVRINRSFAIASKSVTVEQYRKMIPTYDVNKQIAPDDDCPVHWIDWHMAAAYCNWLSAQEGIAADQWCYEINAAGQVTKLKEKYLSLTGYRLPTEAEAEYAYRAGAVTSRCYGETAELLGKYGWNLDNSGQRSWPVGQKKPNDLGLFDVHGNVWCWCQEAYRPYPAARGDSPIDDIEDSLTINISKGRVLRGGSFGNRASYVRSACRFTNAPASRGVNIGFRPARTFTP